MIKNNEYRAWHEATKKMWQEKAGNMPDSLDLTGAIGYYLECGPGRVSNLMDLVGECQKEGISNRDTAKVVQEFLSPYGAAGYSEKRFDIKFGSYTVGIDISSGDQEWHITYICFLGIFLDLYGETEAEEAAEAVTVEDPLSSAGYPRAVYPEDSQMDSPGCGHKYDCFSCHRDCGMRQQGRYCTEAPMGNPFGCEIMEILPELRADIGVVCQFVDSEKARSRAGDGEPVPCCKDCGVEICDYRCKRSDPDIPADTGYMPQLLLEEEKRKLDEMVAVGGLPVKMMERQKTIVWALAAMVTELEMAEARMEPPEQPEIPLLKNNDQRKEWLRDVKVWWRRNTPAVIRTTRRTYTLWAGRRKEHEKT